MPQQSQATARIVLAFMMAFLFAGLLAADVFIGGYTVKILIAALPLAVMLVLLGERVPTPHGYMGGEGDDK